MPTRLSCTNPSVAAEGRTSRCVWLWPAIFVWTAAVAWTWWSLSAYGYKQETADRGAPTDYWPSDTAIEVVSGRPVLLFFMHPRCPCTAASLAEMERLFVSPSRTFHAVPQVIVVATVPNDPAPHWLTTQTIQRARRLPGATLYVDHSGREAERFGATASGTAMWFDEQGRQLYAGGVTLARGHEGDNLGRDQLASLLAGRCDATEGVPALGCTLCLPPSSPGIRD